MGKSLVIILVGAIMFAGCVCGKTKPVCTLKKDQVDKTAVQDSMMKAEAQGVPGVESAQQNAEVPMAK